ncbi:hypothetical protein BAUCODRAFT_68867 [Baudoinia panamericana UAMH 10762]|uniref:Helicase ATP-binding domain-containing protein n=1 Tax=Baudoinia panamericana (strain UAMH 10762) TaxID=717646 RepID=M2NCL1_BAUPA|nr:uncharacterized protein BAUCODRAFT_68867 [Baudoinia panamericana UAMH 10762]EMC96919.1 hypothetical protein BAUCODRAFT_68867 [Baudoinia panamericana UAMH 10762]
MNEVASHRKWREALSQEAGNSSQIAALPYSDPSKSDITINPVRKLGFAPIHIHPHIARSMKDYQINGVRFLWKAISFSDCDEDDSRQGAILAHTMGLGKTMQSIALLVAVKEASESDNEAITRQLPPHLRSESFRDQRQLRMLILCPPTLIRNWQRELDQWAPEALGNIFTVERGKKEARIEEMNTWYRVGGVLLIGYAKFRDFVLRKGRKGIDVDGAQLDKVLLDGPEVVIADEVHNIKNRTSDIAVAANRFKTETRIGLSGTPMSNNVVEIYALVSWACPGYLSEPTEFQANYVEPIEAGLYEDSSAYEVRKMKKKLFVLHHRIAPKVDRQDITALRGSLKPKMEFVITVPLTAVQSAIYKRYVGALLGDSKNAKASQVTIFGWLNLLMLLTNHPAAFRKKLLTPVPPKKAKKGKDAALAEPAPFEEDLFALGFTEAVVKAILGDIDDAIDPAHSAKMSILLGILRLSVKCGDKVLIFSGSIPTIRFVEELLSSNNVAHGTIDGSVPADTRIELIEKFHRHAFDVLIISTRAGGVGLNIQGANRVVLLDFGFNPTWEEQAIGRAYRLGQTKPVFVYRFVAGGTFETNLYNTQLFKTSLSHRVVDKKNSRRNAKRSDTRQYLYPPQPVDQEELAQWVGKDPAVLDVLLKRHVDDGEDVLIRKILTMETLQAEAQEEPLNEEETAEVNEEIRLGPIRGRTAALAASLGTNVSNGFPSTALPNGPRPSPTFGQPRLPVALKIGQPAATQFARSPASTQQQQQAHGFVYPHAPASTAPAARRPFTVQQASPSGAPAFQPLADPSLSS